jgi:hypothetical protein
MLMKARRRQASGRGAQAHVDVAATIGPNAYLGAHGRVVWVHLADANNTTRSGACKPGAEDLAAATQ